MRAFDGADYWLAADAADGAAPAAGRKRTYLLAGFDEYFLGYKDRDAVLEPAARREDRAGRQRASSGR